MMVENYHKHTTWSDLVQIDSATSLTGFMKKLNEYGCKCTFSGEHGYQGEWLYVYDLCRQSQNDEYRKKNGLDYPQKFRYSSEMYWVKDRTQPDKANCHIVIVARNYQAMRKLNYIISKAHTDGFYYKPRIDLNLLFSLSPDDVYITSACIAGWKYDDAEEIWLKIAEHFGNSFFFEYQAHNTDEQKNLNRRILKLSQEYDIQTIAGLDTHYISEEDRIKRENLLKRKGLHYPEEDNWYMDFPSGSELFERFKTQGVLSDEEILTAMMNTHVFLNGCGELEYSTDFKIPIAPQYLENTYEERCEVLKRILDDTYEREPEAYKTSDRKAGLEYEFSQMKDSTAADYFLINYQIIRLATSSKYNGHLTSTSRGSASSYYTSKLLGFTTMDRFESEVPIYPERFVTKERILASHQCPDVDYNVEKQDPFVAASKELIGEHGCYPLLAVGKLGEKSGFKLYADIAGIEPSVANDISKSIDRYNEALKNVEDEEDKKYICIEDYIENPEHLKVFRESNSYQNIVEQARCHACGFLLFNGDHKNTDWVGYGDIRYEIGLIRCVSESTGKTTIVACVEGDLLDSYGYVKNDYLIVDTVGIIFKLYQSIGREVPTVRELRKMVSDDKATWDLYANGITCCLNQCERLGTTKKVMKYKPQNIKELAAFIAAIRPGFKSLLNGFLDRVNYSTGEQAIDDLLADCFHYMLYQEAIMRIFTFLGIDMKESYDTIKKISKKKLVGEKLAHVEQVLKSHWMKNIGNLDNFDEVYKVIKDSARYGFNAPHALAMANDSLYEAWVKAHYPAKFYEVTLNHYQAKGDKNKVADLLSEAKEKFGFAVDSFGYGKDNTQFRVDEETQTIYPDLSSVKGIGRKAVQGMVDISKNNKTDFVEVCLAVPGSGVDWSIFLKLIKIDYFHCFGSVKKLLKVAEICDAWKTRKTLKKTEASEWQLPDYAVGRYVTDALKSGKTSDKRYSIVDRAGFIRSLADGVPNEEYGALQLAKFQYDVLGYINYREPSLSWRYVIVTELNTDYSPKFKAYSIQSGKTVEMKVHKQRNPRNKEVTTSFADIPFTDGQALYISKCKKEPKRQKVGGDWEDVPGVFEWWIKDYMIVE